MVAAAKTHFTLKRMDVGRVEDVVEHAKRFGWSLKPYEVQKAKEKLAQINLL
ncbi:MAG: hypothetical protein QXV97_06005 [Candidatus Caldarchaeum sp.]